MNKIEIDEYDVWLLMYALSEITSLDGLNKLVKYFPHVNLEDFHKHVEEIAKKIRGEAQ